MAFNTVSLVYDYYPDPTVGRPVFNGSIYVGEPDQDPELFPKQVYHRQETGSDVPVTQPLQTGAGGVILINGSPAQIVVDGNYSLRVRDKNGAEVYYDAIRFEQTPNEADLSLVYDTVADMKAGSPQDDSYIRTLGYYSPGDGGGASYWVNGSYGGTPDEFGDHTLASGSVAVLLVEGSKIDVHQYGAKGNGVDDDVPPLQAASDYATTFSSGTAQGGALVFGAREYLLRSPLYINRDVSLLGLSATESRLLQDNQSRGHIVIIRPEGGTAVPFECPRSRIEHLKFAGSLAGFTTLLSSVTSASTTLTTTDTSGLFDGMLIEGNGIDEGTKILSITDGTTLEMDTPANATVTDLNVGFRPNYTTNITTTSGSLTATVTSAVNLHVGMMVESANTPPDTFINEIAGTTLTLSRAATSTGTVACDFSTYNIGIFAYDAISASDYTSSRNYRGPIIEHCDIVQMSGDGIHIRPELEQVVIEHTYSSLNRGSGCIINSCSDSVISYSGFGSCWKHGLIIATSATPRIISTECFQSFRNDIYYEFRSQANSNLTYGFGDINGRAFILNNDGDEHGITFHGVKFLFSSVNNPYIGGTEQAYVYNVDVKGLMLSDCHFEESQDNSKPDYIVSTSGTTDFTTIAGGVLNVSSYTTDISNEMNRTNMVLPVEPNLQKFSTIELNRYAAVGLVARINYDDVQVGQINAFTDRPTIAGNGTGAGVEIGDGAWDGDPLKLGNHWLWVDSLNRLRISPTAPTSDTDGTIVGTQA